MRAWLVTWEWSGAHAAEDESVVAILSARTGHEDVRKYVERCYIEKTASLAEKLSYARYHRPDKLPYPAEFGQLEGVRFLGRITCGHNPLIHARLVDDLRTEADANGNDELRWTEIRPRRPA